MHLAYHEGYIINQPKEFFIKYGPYVKNMIYAFKAFGTVAGFILPNFAFAQQVPIPNILKDGEFWNDFADKMNTVDNVVNNLMAKPTDIAMNPTGSQTYEGADLRQLEKFFKKTDDCRTLGNLYRTTTDEGHVRWVCIKHFNETYSKTRMEEFIRLFEAMGGEFYRQQDQAILKKAVNIKMFCELLSKGFNMYKLSFISYEMREKDFVTLLEAINRSFIKELELSNIKISPLVGSKKASLYIIELIEKHLGTKQYLTVWLDIPKCDAMFNQPKFAQKLLTDHSNIIIKIDNKPYTKQTALDLRGDEISDDGAKAIATALMTNQTLTTLDLADNQISADGAKAIATALITNQTLTTLNLWNNKISADGAKAIATALMTNQTLTTLDLADNQISADEAKGIATPLMTNQTLTTLDLWNNQISDDGAKAIATALITKQTLTTLNLRSNEISDDGAKAIATALMTNQTLTTLNLWNNKISDDGAKAIATALMTNQTLITLNLRFNEISDDEAKAIATALMTNQT
ncbi:unnamed protein product [Didymodactylos carnosus]|uniref:Uncharacterized protein n=2 Tax=Didymodactylos carnosus TaxID=1234261 RepID=A0A815DWI2_9BILA|nr:unnamed protein product [Didymodactylos carnosus]CAF4140681.1 unnamed protein product [Didymodactylos carnosus]